MKCNRCAIVIIISFLVNCGNPQSVSEQDKADLNEYAQEVSRLFVELPMLNKTSGEISYTEHENPLSLGLSPDVTNNISSGGDVTSEENHDAPLFVIDKGINSSTTGSVSQRCLFERRHITAMFKECIQATLSSPAKPSHVSELSTRDYDAKFLKYCRKAPQIRICVKDMIVRKLDHCLDEGVRETIINVEKITERIIKFICISEADRISIFIADGGLDCLFSTNWRMHLCVSVHLGSYVLLSLLELTSLNFEDVKCNNLESAQKCVAHELEMCEDPASAVVAKLIFHIAMEIESCQDLTDVDVSTSGDAPKLSNVQTFFESEMERDRNRNMNVTEINTSTLTPNLGTTEQLSTVSPIPNPSPVEPGRDIHRYSKVGPIPGASSVSNSQGKNQNSTFRSILRASSVSPDQVRYQHSTFRPIIRASSVASDEGKYQHSTFHPIGGTSSVVSGEGKYSTVLPTLKSTSVATSKDQPSTPSPNLEATPNSPKHKTKAAISSKSKSSTTTGNLMSNVLLVLMVIIIVI